MRYYRIDLSRRNVMCAMPACVCDCSNGPCFTFHSSRGGPDVTPSLYPTPISSSHWIFCQHSSRDTLWGPADGAIEAVIGIIIIHHNSIGIVISQSPWTAFPSCFARCYSCVVSGTQSSLRICFITSDILDTDIINFSATLMHPVLIQALSHRFLTRPTIAKRECRRMIDIGFLTVLTPIQPHLAIPSLRLRRLPTKTRFPRCFKLQLMLILLGFRFLPMLSSNQYLKRPAPKTMCLLNRCLSVNNTLLVFLRLTLQKRQKISRLELTSFQKDSMIPKKQERNTSISLNGSEHMSSPRYGWEQGWFAVINSRLIRSPSS
uniref:Uncharacterized protein n=1 Tax=Spongospora subterranea TaxID=70186 RepID=A0A0H5R8T7_9EUKA|eukprot:CRZ10132.1 hypothetical protein [Spongospora subterranea]